MEFGISNPKMKVVWLCHFANQEMKEYFNKPDIKVFSPWISTLISLFKSRKDIELHIVAPNVFNNTDCSFVHNGIHYHFYPVRHPLFSKKINTLVKIIIGTNYSAIQSKINKIISEINPDIIHLHGAENPYYSSGIIPLFNKYPILTTVQGFIRQTSHKSSAILKSIKIEEEILKKSKHIGVRSIEMNEIVLQINPDANLHFHNYPLSVPSVLKNNIGKTEPVDCLYFARLSKEKGIEDLLKAISIVKKVNSDITVSVIGGANKKYLTYLNSLCSNLNIQENVKFLGFLPTQEDIYKYAFQAKLCVLPTYHDIIPGTIIESMYMKLPVIAYAVGGIPELNLAQETIMLVDKHDISQLAVKIIQLIKDVELRKQLAENAYNYVNKRLDNAKVVNDIINAYKLILNEDSTK